MGFASEVRPWIKKNLALHIPVDTKSSVDTLVLESSISSFKADKMDFERYFILVEDLITRNSGKREIHKLYHSIRNKTNMLLFKIRKNAVTEEDIIDYLSVEICSYLVEIDGYMPSKEILHYLNDIHNKYKHMK